MQDSVIAQYLAQMGVEAREKVIASDDALNEYLAMNPLPVSEHPKLVAAVKQFRVRLAAGKQSLSVDKESIVRKVYAEYAVLVQGKVALSFVSAHIKPGLGAVLEDLQDRSNCGYFCEKCLSVRRKNEEVVSVSNNRGDNTYTVTCVKCGTVLTDEEWNS